jgi:hypothetical protein
MIAVLTLAAAVTTTDAARVDRMIDAAGVTLHITCAGERQPRAPLVVLEAGAGNSAGDMERRDRTDRAVGARVRVRPAESWLESEGGCAVDRRRPCRRAPRAPRGPHVTAFLVLSHVRDPSRKSSGG